MGRRLVNLLPVAQRTNAFTHDTVPYTYDSITTIATTFATNQFRLGVFLALRSVFFFLLQCLLYDTRYLLILVPGTTGIMLLLCRCTRSMYCHYRILHIYMLQHSTPCCLLLLFLSQSPRLELNEGRRRHIFTFYCRQSCHTELDLMYLVLL